MRKNVTKTNCITLTEQTKVVYNILSRKSMFIAWSEFYALVQGTNDNKVFHMIGDIFGQTTRYLTMQHNVQEQ